MIEKFKRFLINNGLSENTIVSYLHSVNQFNRGSVEITKSILFAYKSEIIEKYKPKTVNLKIQGINKYLEFIGKDKMKLKFIKIQQKNYLENVISNSDYDFLKNQLRKDNNVKWYFVVRYLASTGSRVSELVQFKVEHVLSGSIDLYTKGGKIRRIYIPNKLKKESQLWLNSQGKDSGYIFENKNGNRITTRGIAHQLKELGKKYKMNLKVLHPHSFRHLYGKNFIAKYKDIALLADLMGHDSIETTRIYLRRTSEEQQAIVDKIVDW